MRESSRTNNYRKGLQMIPHRPNRTRVRHAANALFLSLCLAGIAVAAPISGALFTSDVNGTVNVNHYDAKADVYLSGGPDNSNCAAAALDDGVYVFQITNPSGTVVLSSDAITAREFTVANGVITGANNHAVVPGDCGGVRVQMIPFDDTPNNGGVYKAWVTRKSDYTANGNVFRPSDTKTDNFHVKEPAIEPQTADLNVYKFYDANANGDWDPDEMPLFGWAMRTQNGNAFDSTQLTQSPDGLTSWTGLDPADNPWSVTEGTAGGTWHQSASIIDGAPTGSPTNPVTGLNLVAGETTEVIFGNYCTCKGANPKSFWVTTSGMNKVNDGGTMNPEFNALNQLNLRTAAGGNFNLNTALAQSANWTTLVNYLNNTSTTNMALSLSRNLAVLRLNLDAGYIVGADLYPAFGGTVNELRDMANAALGADGLTPVGDEPNRTTQSQLNNWIIALNNGATLIRSTPCKFTFTVPTAPPG